MTPEERQKHLADLPKLMFAIHGVLKTGERDAVICLDELSFKKELEKFEIFRTYKMVEIHKR